MNYLEDISLKKLITLIKTALKSKVSKSGDTMTGDLTLEKSAPYLTLKHTTTGRQGRMAATGDNYLSIYNEDTDDASNNKVALWLAPESTAVDNLFRINHVLEGESNTYRVIHSGSTEGKKLNYTNIAYGTCSTAAATAAKVITVSGNTNWTLTAGSIICVKFTATNTAQNPTLNVNGTGAKSIWYNTALVTTSYLNIGGTATVPQIYMYDGTQYVWLGRALDSNTTYPISSKSATTAATAGWYRIATSASGIHNCTGIFQIRATVSGKHTMATITADTSYGFAHSTNINVLSSSSWETPALTKARIVYTSNYSGNYAYLEVYLSSATAIPISVNLYGNTGWTLVAPSTVGSVPDGYSTKEKALVQGGGGKEDFSATITTTWTGSTAPYYQSITVNGIIADDKPLVDVTMSGTYATDQERLADWGKIYRIVTAANKITVYATDKTTVSLPIQLQVVR